MSADAIRPFALTHEEKLRLGAVAEEVVKRTVEEYNEHLTVYHGVVDERRWKKIKQCENLRVYFERHRPAGCKYQGDAQHSGDVLAQLLGFGTIEGSLDDVLYGVITPTTSDMHIKTAYVEDGLVDSAVLASILTPTENEPFRELGVKWLVKSHPLLISAVMHTRDVVYIDSSGCAQTPSGERIGYHLKHSVDIPDTIGLANPSVVRAQGSVCYIFRQRDPTSVEMFYRGAVSPMGNVSAAMMATSTAEISVSAWKNSYCAEMKKLTRVLQSISQQIVPCDQLSWSSSTSSGADSLSLRNASARSADGNTTCAQCGKSLSCKFRLASSKGKSCAICKTRVCSRCRVLKTVYLPAGPKGKELTGVTKTLCTLCMSRVTNSSSNAFAVLDARAARGEVVDYKVALASV